MNKSKGHYLDCLEIISRNSRDCDYIKNQASDLRNLIEDYFQLQEDHQKLERSYFGQQTTIRNLQESLERYRNYRNK